MNKSTDRVLTELMNTAWVQIPPSSLTVYTVLDKLLNFTVCFSLLIHKMEKFIVFHSFHHYED